MNHPKTSSDTTNWAKDSGPFIKHPTNLETKPEQMTTFITPNSHFFVCNQTRTARVALDDYRLRVEGDAVEQPLELSYDDILRLPSHTVLAYLECAGNQRMLFDKVLGQAVRGQEWTQWGLGGVGMAEWTGVSLRTVLEQAGLKPNAVEVNAQGLDRDAPEGGTQRPMPIEKALDEDTVLAYAMNGERLPPDHGFPLRLIVPGWIGANSIKWVGTMTVSSAKIWTERNTETYVFRGPEWPSTQYAPAQGGPITTQNIKSSLALPWNAELSNGSQLIRGVARSPHAPIATVEWSADGGQTWQAARLIPPFLKYSWTRFEFTWQATPGNHTLMTRATDEAGQTQPPTQLFNEHGYLFNMVYPHPVRIVSR